MSRARAASKNSRVTSVATQAIQGLDGSETITSYRRGVSSRWDRPSPTIRRTSGREWTFPLSLSKKRDASTTSGEISTTSIDSAL